MINIESFISRNITKRSQSLFANDLSAFEECLRNRIQGKSALVIGGAGTIGSSYIKALLKYNPARLYVVDINENGLTELTRDLRSNLNTVVPEEYKTYPIDLGSKEFERILVEEGPFEIVANFAAHKHVRSEKDHYSISALINNNIVKANKLLKLLLTHKPETFFCVSTDKATNPVNIMGASKKIMEEVIMAYSSQIKISTARFANVAFSNGSLLDGFVNRIMKKQPFSAPADIKRYFVSPIESGQICLLASILGESTDIFFPKLEKEQMMTFTSISDEFLKEQGYQPELCDTEVEAKQKALNFSGSNYPVYYFKTDTSGEKPFEEFYTDDEKVDFDKYNALGVIKDYPCKSIEEVDMMVEEFTSVLGEPNLSKKRIVEVFEKYLDNFKHIEKGKNLDSKM